MPSRLVWPDTSALSCTYLTVRYLYGLSSSRDSMVSQTMSDETASKTNGFRDTAERLTQGDRVQYSVEDSGSVTGTVCKSNRGGIRVLPDGGSLLHVIKTGCILSTVNRDGGALRRRHRKGRLSSFEILNETGAVAYEDNNGGWVHVPEEESA